MSLKDVRLKPQYVSLRDDVAREFYIPLMKECTRFDRVSCYFSLGALAKYSEGLYYLGKRKDGRYRLIISNNIDEATFGIIKEGYVRQRYLDDFVKERMKDELSLNDRLNLSNLSYLMGCGVVEIKFGLCFDGLFHSKSGYVEDSEGNALCFTGSNNETRMSLEHNYEKFDVTTSWLSSDFDRRRVGDTREEFDGFWNNTSPYAVVFDPPETFNEYMAAMNRGRLIADVSDLTSDALFLDIEGDAAFLKIPPGAGSADSIRFGAKIMEAVESCSESRIVFKSNLNRRQLKDVHDRLDAFRLKKGLELEMSDAFRARISGTSNMESLALLGRAIKRRDPSLEAEFEAFRSIVDENTVRKLREEQMRDSFFIYKMGNAANFSVPGSGKTSTILGVFAYLRAIRSCERIVVIGPLNSFDSWTTEFGRVFGDLVPLKTFRSDSHPGKLAYDYRFNSGGTNLQLFNYECFDHDWNLVELLASRIDSKTLLVLDEVHRVKRIGGERANRMLAISKNAPRTIVMTGTPIPNQYSDAYNFLHMLFGDDDYDEFFSLSPDSLDSMTDAQTEEFNRRMYPFFCRTTKQRLGVPPANEDDVVTVLASERETALIDRLRAADICPFVKIIRMMQLESDPSMILSALSGEELDYFDATVSGSTAGMNIDIGDPEPSSKLRACIDVVSRLVGEGKKVIVWCIFLRSMDNIEAALKSEGIRSHQINGATQNRSAVIDGFRRGDYDVLITNPQTLSESVSLHDICHDAVYFEFNYNLVHLLQSKDRIHRLGLPAGQYTQYHFIEMQFIDGGRALSLDGEIHNRLLHKENVMLNAIENDVFELYGTTSDEVEDILREIGMIAEDENGGKRARPLRGIRHDTSTMSRSLSPIFVTS